MLVSGSVKGGHYLISTHPIGIVKVYHRISQAALTERLQDERRDKVREIPWSSVVFGKGWGGT